MKLLILGGSQFAGRFLVEQGAERGHTVHVFNRAQSLDPSESAANRQFIGDRDPRTAPGLTALKEAVATGETWDAVIDMCGYVPRVVRASTELLRTAARHYLFVSSISVYPTDGPRGRTEDAPFVDPPPEGDEEIRGDTYGGLKRQCELVVREVFGEGAVIVRPGLIVGPRDPTDRFTYWVRRLDEGRDGNTVLAAEPRTAPAQFIDARDLSAFMLHLIEQGAGGDYNATGSVSIIGDMLEGIRTALGSNARLVWAERPWLAERGFEAFKDLPLTIDAGSEGFLSFDCAKARSAGLTTRPLSETAQDLAAWDRDRGRPKLKAGMSREREGELLKTLSEESLSPSDT
jgi:2'-hydroxyisoflavone reductase